jgi:hypothetical protein
VKTELTRHGTWFAMRGVCECGCGHTLISAVGATKKAAADNFEHAQKVAASVEAAFAETKETPA